MPSGDPDDAHLLAALERAGMSYAWVPWNTVDPKSLGERVDVLVLRSPWDYPEHHEDFLSWLEAIPVPVHNKPDIVRWNSNKKYLLDLAAAGVPTVPTQIIEDDSRAWVIPAGFEEFVVKPSIGVGSMGARRFARSQFDDAQAHVDALLQSGRPVMIQPYLPSVDAGSETALIHFDGVFSHSITKGPMLTNEGQRPLVDDLYVVENIDKRVASQAQRDVAQRVLAALPGAGTPPLYARIDVIDDLDGNPIVLEAELIEPSLFFTFAPESADRFVEAIRARV